jgi:hypothetical protein
MPVFEREIGKYVDAAEVARLAQYVYVPIDLNTGTDAQFLTIPGVGSRMVREFKEYRPWTSPTVRSVSTCRNRKLRGSAGT